MTGPTEATTRRELIDPALKKAGWDVGNPDQVGIEIPVDGFDAAAWQRLEGKLRESGGNYAINLPSGISDYVLKQANGQIVAVVEAKRTSISPALAEAQTEFYVEEIEKMQGLRPFAFMTNVRDIYFWDVGEDKSDCCSLKRLKKGHTIEDDQTAVFNRCHCWSRGLCSIGRT